MADSERLAFHSLNEIRRQKRRPPLACIQCRRRKIKCDRCQPCQQCQKAGNEYCTYAHDKRRSLSEAPFRAQETQFSVFHKLPLVPDQTFASGSLAEPLFSTGTEPEYDFSGLSGSVGSGTSGFTPEAWDTGNFMDFDSQLDTALEQYQPEFESAMMSESYSEGRGALLLRLGPDTARQASIEPTPPSTISSTDDLSKFPDIRPLFTKERYGPSHWVHFLRMPPQVKTVIQQQEMLASRSDDCDIHTYESCRILKNEIRTRIRRQADAVSIHRILPSRRVADRLVQAYLHTFQSLFAILDIPLFRAQYDDIWKSPEPPRGITVCLLLFVLCVGSTCLPPEARVSWVVTQSWFYAAVSWVREAAEKADFNMDWLRLRCLQILARQVLWQKPSAVIQSTASIVREALDRLRRGTDHVAGHAVSGTLGKETESRLLAIVVELDIQEAMLCGRLPVINDHEFQLYLRSNAGVDGPSSVLACNSKAEFTELSFHGLLQKTLPLRLKIARYVNNSNQEKRYEETLALGQELLAALDVCKSQIDSFRMSSRPPTTCQIRLFDLLNYGFLLGLHHAFAVQARDDPAYHYSLTICRSTSLSLLAAMSGPENEDFRRLCLQGSRLLCDVHRKSALYLLGEMMHESQANSLFARDPVTLLTRREMRRGVQGYLELSRSRVAAGDISVKFYLLLSSLIVFADKPQFGARAREEVTFVWKRNLELCHSRLRALRLEQKGYLTSDLRPSGISEISFDSAGVGFLL
ncbi:hypothetical protein F5Y19DRAFT_333649 [Xylariaceae sp. FL1651]|nr:hypothetical protein F5Y19DRAFT_333649 [Xylariaceae sp. FL1651]